MPKWPKGVKACGNPKCQRCTKRGMGAFVCHKSGHAQHWAPPDKGGGVTREEAEHIGWRLMPEGWLCPHCTGNDENLKSIFKKATGQDPDEE